MNYDETVEYIINRPRTHTRTDLSYMRDLLTALGNPEDKLKFVHIAGTNGKGSATVMMASVLKEAGYKVGCNISPYVIDFRERFMINGEMIAPQALQEVADIVIAAANKLDESSPRPGSTFELTTAIAFLWFAREKCDIACVEVGLGGLNDITNVIKNTELACIMAIDYDHTERLGKTLDLIAAQKCGIFKPGCAAVSYPGQAPEAAAVIERMAAEAGCELTVPEEEDIATRHAGPFDYRLSYGGYTLRQPFPGAHQSKNASVVIEGALALWRRGWKIDDEAIERGIENARLPARIEVISKAPLILLDGSHNAGGFAALAATLKTEKVQGITAVVGILGDKQAGEMLATLAPFAGRLLAVAPNSHRALTADQLAGLGRGLYPDIEVCPTVARAIEEAGREGKGVLVCGSLYLASEARPILLAMAQEEQGG